MQVLIISQLFYKGWNSKDKRCSDKLAKKVSRKIFKKFDFSLCEELNQMVLQLKMHVGTLQTCN